MNLDKSKKRIAKKAKMGFQGYPTLTIVYSGPSAAVANKVVIKFVAEEGSDEQVEQFTTQGDAREDEMIQSAIVKMIERSAIKTVVSSDVVTVS